MEMVTNVILCVVIVVVAFLSYAIGGRNSLFRVSVYLAVYLIIYIIGVEIDEYT